MCNGADAGRIEKGQATHEFVYGLAPEAMGGDYYMLVELEASRLALAALKCRTLGEYAKVVGYTVKGLIEERGKELEAISKGAPVDENTGFNLASIWGLYYIGDLVKEPRAAACDVLRGRRAFSVFGIRWSHGAPGSDFEEFTATDPDAFERLAAHLNAQGKDSYVFRRDDAYIRECMKYFTGAGGAAPSLV